MARYTFYTYDQLKSEYLERHEELPNTYHLLGVQVMVDDLMDRHQRMWSIGYNESGRPVTFVVED
jgi:hypothetical protein